MPTQTRSYVSGSFYLMLDGKGAGFMKSVEGGSAVAEVINEPPGPDYFIKKHIGPPRYEAFTLQFGWSMSKAVYDWIKAAWNGDYQRKDGSIIAADYNLEAKSAREFLNALITEFTIPAMDGSAKDPGYMTLKFAPESTQFKKASGKLAADQRGKGRNSWLRSNFRLEIDGLDCSKVHKIDSFTVKQVVVTDAIGGAHDWLEEPGKTDFPNLKISLAEVAAQSWIDWHEDFVIQGNNDESREKNGFLIFLAPNLKKDLGRINLHNLGIFKLTPAKWEANADQIQRVTAELYCERMEFVYAET